MLKRRAPGIDARGLLARAGAGLALACAGLGGPLLAAGTAAEDDPPPRVAIRSIQGAGHVSPWAGRCVQAAGVVTAVDGVGFHLQDPGSVNDGIRSEAVFVYTRGAPGVLAGDVVLVTGRVQEYVPGGPATHNLSVTEIAEPKVEVLGVAAALPEPVRLGPGGRAPPTETIDDDGLSRFEPAADGIDFFESLEGMRVSIDAAVVVGPTDVFGETFVVAPGATGSNARGGVTFREGDPNPERLRVAVDADLVPGLEVRAQVGDLLPRVVGVIDYRYGSFELRATEPFAVVPGGLAEERTALRRGPRHATVATYNVENLHPGQVERFPALAAHVVVGLAAPDVVGLQEVQDDDGPRDTGTVSADETWGRLVEAIAALGGPRYAFADLPPEDGRDGGQPGGNIRVGYLYDPERVALLPGSLERILDAEVAGGDAFAASRKPLAATFVWHDGSGASGDASRGGPGLRLTLVNVHFRSRSGSTPLFGAVQPPRSGGVDRRVAQAEAVARWLGERGAREPEARFAVLGDLNELPFEPPLDVLRGEEEPLLVDLGARLPDEERYTYVFDGNAQQLDHVLVSPALAPHAELDIVHLNAELQGGASDHDPVVARLRLVPEPSPRWLLMASLAVLAALRATGRGGAGGDGFRPK